MADKDTSLLLGEIKGRIDMMVTLFHPRISALEGDVKDLQAWRWKAVGAGGVLGTILGYVLNIVMSKIGG